MTSLKLKIFLVISVALILPRSVYSHAYDQRRRQLESDPTVEPRERRRE